VTRDIPGTWRLESMGSVGVVKFEDEVLDGFPGAITSLPVDLIEPDGHFLYDPDDGSGYTAEGRFSQQSGQTTLTYEILYQGSRFGDGPSLLTRID